MISEEINKNQVRFNKELEKKVDKAVQGKD
jgi:hypothetical protein